LNTVYTVSRQEIYPACFLLQAVQKTLTYLFTFGLPLQQPCSTPKQALQTNKRILSIDAFRGITIFTMVFVNELAGVRNIPQWMKHMPADADAMSFVDLVFPAFLFIVGMSIPFAIQHRESKADSWLKIQVHIGWRSFGLLTLGFFLVNAEEEFNAQETGLSQHQWLLFFYLAALLTWNLYTFSNKKWEYLFRFTGITILLLLALVYRGGAYGEHTMRPHWWGILGLIGWAYLFGCLFYQLLKGNLLLLGGATACCIVLYMVFQMPAIKDSEQFGWLGIQAGHAAHTSIVLCGITASQIFFKGRQTAAINIRFARAGLFALVLFAVGFALRPYYKISKIYATPTWCLYSAALCTIIFSLLYWLIDLKKINQWTVFFKPAATNPLLTYMLPGMVFSIASITGITLLPDRFKTGITGIAWCLLYAVVIMLLAKALNKIRIRMQL
jgi:heparan-alpha-glucosaminide N-acetyltransferase